MRLPLYLGSERETLPMNSAGGCADCLFIFISWFPYRSVVIFVFNRASRGLFSSIVFIEGMPLICFREVVVRAERAPNSISNETLPFFYFSHIMLFLQDIKSYPLYQSDREAAARVAFKCLI